MQRNDVVALRQARTLVLGGRVLAAGTLVRVLGVQGTGAVL